MVEIITPPEIRLAREKQAVKEMKQVTPIIELFLHERNITKQEASRMCDTQLRILHSSYILHWHCYGKHPITPYFLFKAVCENNPEIYYPDVSSYRTEKEIINDYAEYIKTCTVETKNSHIRFRLTVPKFFRQFYEETHAPEIRVDWIQPVKEHLRLGNITCGKAKRIECLLGRQWKTTCANYEGEQEFWKNNPAVRVEEI